jgi:hypothetical protein
MARERDKGRRANRNAFRPTLDGRLEPRWLLSQLSIVKPQVGIVGTHTAREGRSINVIDTDGEQYRINATNEAIVRAVPTLDGRLDLIVTGSRFDSELVIERRRHPPEPTAAHEFPIHARNADSILHIRNITIRTGAIGGILGFGTADLSGRIVVRNRVNPDLTPTIDRIALYALRPGARIITAGSVDTLEVLTSVNLSRPRDGIFVGQDLNFLAVGGDFNLSNGASVIVSRDLGAFGQLPKGTGRGGAGGILDGDLSLSNTSQFTVQRNFVSPIRVQGNFFRNGALVVSGPFSFQTNIFAP